MIVERNNFRVELDEAGNIVRFFNIYDKWQNVTEGYYFSTRTGEQLKLPFSIYDSEKDKKVSANYTDYYRTDHRSVDTAPVNVDINDRVKFVLSDSNENRSSCIDAAVKAFGMDRGEARQAFDGRRTIVCRPDQFARFIIYRYNTVRGNQIRSLEPKLIPANDPKLYDVSRN